jgi:hypothetical protein
MVDRAVSIDAATDPISVKRSDNPFIRMFHGIRLEDRWMELMTRHPDRFMLGFDRWETLT